MALLRFACALFILAFAACTGDDREPEPNDPVDGGFVGLDATQSVDSVLGSEAGLDAAPGDAESQLAVQGAPNYQRDLRPLLESHCVSCHGRGGSAPFSLDNYDTVRLFAARIISAVESGQMPPFPADPSCRELRDVRTMPREARGAFRAWQKLGYPEGSPSDYVPPAPALPERGTPTRIMAAGVAYAPKPRAEEHRCFVLGGFGQDTYLSALEVLPDRRGQVRRVQIHSVSAPQRAAVEQLDAAEPGLGYACADGPGLAAHTLFSYGPGSGALSFERGDAAYVAAGSLLVMRVHYDTRSLRSGELVLSDQTKLALWTLPPGELPDRIVYRTELSGNNLSLPAGNPHVVVGHSRALSQVSTLGPSDGGVFLPGEIIGAAPNANQLASRMGAELRHAAGNRDCLVEVPDWKFAFQLDYMFARALPFSSEDALDVACEYDNSEANQPSIDGKRQPARNVSSGERATDELCLHSFWLRYPREAFLTAQQHRH